MLHKYPLGKEFKENIFWSENQVIIDLDFLIHTIKQMPKRIRLYLCLYTSLWILGPILGRSKKRMGSEKFQMRRN